MQDEIQEIAREIARLEDERKDVAAAIRALQDEEDHLKGVFRAAEIHAAKQDKLRLDFEIQFRKNRINRIRFGL